MTSARDVDVGDETAGDPLGGRAAVGLLVVGLDDARALEPALTGGKAAALARAAAAGLRTLPGVVLTTAFCAEIDAGARVDGHPAVREVLNRCGGAGARLVVRSSSVAEDTDESSMAGQFASVIDVRGLDALVDAVQTVLDSRTRAGAADQPIAVLVQPLLAPEVGGVMFGVEPVTGRTDRRVIAAAAGAPEALVSGQVEGSRYVLDADGAVVEESAGDGPTLDAGRLAELAALSDEVAEVFGGPQDVEWAIDTDGTLWLLQSRPVTTEVRGVPRGPIYGPGPVAETFPEPLTELEVDLWVPPLREAVAEAVVLAGAATRHEVDDSDVVVAVDGHVAIDLRLVGALPERRRAVRTLNPVRALRRLRGAWQVGRLRSAMPALSERLLDRVDKDLEAVPALSRLTGRQLLGLLHRSRTVLRALHAHEILMGLLTDTGGHSMTGAALALRVLAEARQDGLSDDEVLARSPIVLALAPPRVAPQPALPGDVSALHLGPDGSGEDANDNGLLREALRLRVRWVQELSGRAAWALGERMAAAGALPRPGLIRHLDLAHVEAVATKRALIVADLVSDHEHDGGAPLPAWFQLSDRGRPVRVQSAQEVGGGTGAGGGVATGIVTYDADDPPAGSVLVTTTLTPGLGPLLPRLSGIVSETGSVLSHLAILAREGGVAVVVGYAGARSDLPEGARVVVDGDEGRVTIEDEETAS
ncbi:MAG TPA: PEP/pyruvate-binding domain-containing protein [Acidimicrobiales bacterium]|nr:PEP/pyruvate-binding domain-containing protein [Acidimicrobiales bacterium]